MGSKSRNKGADGERELINLIRDNTGLKLERNLAQSFGGGHDLLGLEEWAIECKRYHVVDLSAKKIFWRQAVDQAKRIDKRPVVAYREDRRPWRVIVAWPSDDDLYPIESFDATAEISLELFCALIRETLNETESNREGGSD